MLQKEGKHRTFMELEFWAEEGLIFIEDRRDGDFSIVTCSDFVKRASALNREAKRTHYASDREFLQDAVLSMHETFKEAKAQGDPSDIEVAKMKYKSRRKASLITGRW